MAEDSKDAMGWSEGESEEEGRLLCVGRAAIYQGDCPQQHCRLRLQISPTSQSLQELHALLLLLLRCSHWTLVRVAKELTTEDSKQVQSSLSRLMRSDGHVANEEGILRKVLLHLFETWKKRRKS